MIRLIHIMKQVLSPAIFRNCRLFMMMMNNSFVSTIFNNSSFHDQFNVISYNSVCVSCVCVCVCASPCILDIAREPSFQSEPLPLHSCQAMQGLSLWIRLIEQLDRRPDGPWIAMMTYGNAHTRASTSTRTPSPAMQAHYAYQCVQGKSAEHASDTG